MDDHGTVTDGLVLVSQGIVKDILPAGATPPAGVNVVDTQGIIYPGLHNLHDHLDYDFLPVYPVDREYGDRDQWPSGLTYDEYVNNPKNLVTDPALFDAGEQALAYALLMQVVGGTTAVQGAPPTAGVNGLVRNVQVQNADIAKGDAVGADVIGIDPRMNAAEATKLKASWGKLDAMFYHLSEGTDSRALQDYYNLKSLGLVQRSLVGIHCTALTEKEFEDWHTITGEGPKVVWSPLSNLLLYGSTTDILAARRHGATIALGTDWTPSGSKNLLWELKIADLLNKQKLGGALSDQELVAMVTRNPAQLLNWGQRTGQIKPGMVADLLVVDDGGGDPYRNLIDAVEHNVRLVCTGGKPVYGDSALISPLRGRGLQVLDDFKGRPKVVDFGELSLPVGLSSLDDLVASIDAAEQFSPAALVAKLNTASAGPEPFRHRESIKAWLVEQYQKDRAKPAIPPELTDASAPITEQLVQEYLMRKYPNARPLHGVTPLPQETDDAFFAALESNPNLSKALNISALQRYRQG